MPIIAVCNQKGGVGKTTTAVSLAHGLVIKGKKVLLMDLDPQGQAATLLGVKQDSGAYEFLVSSRITFDQALTDTGREDFYFISGDKQTSAAQIVIRDKPINYLKEKIAGALSMVDYVIFDTAPSVGDLQGQAIFASDYLLIPCAADFLSSEGVFKLLETAGDIRENYSWNGKLLGLLPTFYDDTTRESKATIEDLIKHFGEKQVLPHIHRATVLRECSAMGKTIFELSPESRAAKEYEVLINHTLRVTK